MVVVINRRKKLTTTFRTVNIFQLKMHFKIFCSLGPSTNNLEVDNLGTVHWLVDASDNTHMDCKGHTGGAMMYGKEATIIKLANQKL